MAKETYYFSHDYDPTGDPKMQAMIGNYGGMGYGIFWRIVEMLHADDNHRLPLKKYIFQAIAKQMQANAEQNQAKERKGKEIVNTQLCPAMVDIFKDCYPDYPEDKEQDFSACLQIAYKIAKAKDWKKETVLNGKLKETLAFWSSIVDFSKSDIWFSTRAISDFNKEFQRLIQKMNNGKSSSPQGKQTVV